MTTLTAMEQSAHKRGIAVERRGRERPGDPRKRTQLVRLAGSVVGMTPPALWARVGGAAGALASRASRSPLAAVALGIALAQLIRIPYLDRARAPELPAHERSFAVARERPAQPDQASASANTGLGSSLIAVLRRSASAFFADDVLTLAGALTFSTLLSFAPLMLLALWATTAVGPGAQEALLAQLAALAGNDARVAAQAVIDSASKRPSVGSVAGIVGIVVALGGATAVFIQLQTSLNRIWQIPAKPAGAVWGWLRRRVLSIGLLVSLAFFLSISLLVSAALALMLTGTGIFWEIVNETIGTAVFAGLFAGLFRYLPDARLPWRHALGGGLVTAILFVVGKFLIGLYLAHGSVGSAYGAAGSLVVLLVWVYYASAIFLFGAETVKGWLAEHGNAPHVHQLQRGPSPVDNAGPRA
jgi:membrane protein